jgi:hypothetical protein
VAANIEVLVLRELEELSYEEIAHLTESPLVEGEIVAFEQIAVVLRRTDGATTRIPNHMLVEGSVTTERPAP